MQINEYRNELLSESVYCARHSSGLEIRVLPQSDAQGAYALFAVKYGSIDTSVPDLNGSYKPIPEGTAHFLEHKLFESEDLDAFERFAKTGAQANAYTSFEQTAYLFKGSENIMKSLDILLDFVQKPYFTKQTVEKEQGIIGQEIVMYNDVADWVVMFNLLKALYVKHPVKIDIAGTVQSIAQIDDKLLYDLYNTYYNPSNMCLCVVGNVDKDEIFEKVENSIIRSGAKVPQREIFKEPEEVCQNYIEKRLPVNQSQFLFGIKEQALFDKNEGSQEVSLSDELAGQMLLEILAGSSSPLFKKLVENDLTDMNFSTEYFCGTGYSAFLFGGISRQPQKAVQMIKQEIENTKKNGIDKAAFERAKRKMYGNFVMNYNEQDSIAALLISLHFTGYEPFAEMHECKNMTLEKVTQRLNALNLEYSALSVVMPQSD